MVYVKAVTLYSSMGNKTTQPQEIPAKNYRFVFRSNGFADNDNFYLDPTDASEYMDIWLQIKDLPWMQPVEFESYNAMVRNKQATAVSMGDIAVGYQSGYAWGLHDEADIKNKDMEQRDEVAAANQKAAYYEGKSDGSSSGSSGSSGDSGLGIIGDVLDVFGLGFSARKEYKKRPMDKDLHKTIESFIKVIHKK